MSQPVGSKLEILENNNVKIMLYVNQEMFEEGIKHAYNRQRSKINLPGFRKGKAPRHLIEMQYGKEVFYDDALDFTLPELYKEALLEHDIDVVSEPSFSVVEIGEGKGAVVSAEVTVKPSVTVSDYIGIPFTKAECEVSDEELEKEINEAREKNARFITVTDRPVQNGDFTDIDFKGFVDGVAFEGGESQGYELEIGSGVFIPGFEDQLVGKNIGEKVEVNVTFPDNYGAEHLKSKPAVFEVTVNSIRVKELPEVNDEFAQDVSEFETLAEYKDDIRATIKEMKEHDAEHRKEEEILEVLASRTTVDIPQVMVETEIDHMVNNFGSYLRKQGLSLEAFLTHSRANLEDMRNSYKAPAEKNVKSRLALEAVANMENMTVTDEEIDAEIARMAESYQIDADKLASTIGKSERKALALDLKVQKAHTIIMDGAVQIDAPVNSSGEESGK